MFSMTPDIMNGSTQINIPVIQGEVPYQKEALVCYHNCPMHTVLNDLCDTSPLKISFDKNLL